MFTVLKEDAEVRKQVVNIKPRLEEGLQFGINIMVRLCDQATEAIVTALRHCHAADTCRRHQCPIICLTDPFVCPFPIHLAKAVHPVTVGPDKIDGKANNERRSS